MRLALLLVLLAFGMTWLVLNEGAPAAIPGVQGPVLAEPGEATLEGGQAPESLRTQVSLAPDEDRAERRAPWPRRMRRWRASWPGAMRSPTATPSALS